MNNFFEKYQFSFGLSFGQNSICVRKDIYENTYLVLVDGSGKQITEIGFYPEDWEEFLKGAYQEFIKE